MNRKILLAIFIILCIGLSFLLFYNIKDNKITKNNTFVISIPINGVISKSYDDDFLYLTVQLDDSIIKQYNLDFNDVKYKVNKNIYNNINNKDEYISITIVCNYPNISKEADLNNVSKILKDENKKQCEIVSIVNKNNEVIS